MGQLVSRIGPPPSPVDRAARSIDNIISNATSASASRDLLPPPIPCSPNHTERAEDAWDTILRAESVKNLRRAIKAFLRDWHVKDLLQFVAQAAKEPKAETRQRFVLRYLDDRYWDNLPGRRRVALLAQLLQDELDLPGFRFKVALRQWQCIFDDILDINVRDQRDRDYWTSRDALRTRIERFIRDQGFDRLVECLEETHEGEVLDKPLGGVCTEDLPGGRVIYDPAQPLPVVARDILDWLLGEDDLHLTSSGRLAGRCRPEWEGGLDEAPPRDDIQSFESALAAVDRTPLRWRVIYIRLLRHIDLFGAEELLKHLLRELSEEMREQWMTLDAGTITTGGKLRRADACLAAVIADYLATRQRDLRGIEMPDELIPRPQQPRSRGLSPSIDNARHEQPTEENNELRNTNAELEATIATLTDDIVDLREQLDMQAQRRKPRHCLLCERHLADEDTERTHMAVHRRELNEYREKNCMKAYGLGPSPLPQKRRNAPLEARGSREIQRSPQSSPDPLLSSSPPLQTTSNKRKATKSPVGERPGVIRRRLIAVEIPVDNRC